MALIGLVSSFCIVLLLLSMNVMNISYLLTALLLFFACAAWLLFLGRGTRNITFFDSDLVRNKRVGATLNISFFIVQTLIIFALYSRPDPYQRPLSFFVLISVMVAIVAFEIFIREERKTYLVLIMIMLIGINLAWSQASLYPGLLGDDTWWHFNITQTIIKGGVIPDGTPYSFFPVFHTLLASTSLTSGISYESAAIVLSGTGQIALNVIFIFLIGHHITKNAQISLLAALLVVLASNHIQMSVNFIPNSLASIFIPIIIFLILKMNVNRSLMMLAVLHLFMVVTVLTHTVTALCVSFILSIGYLALRFYICHIPEKRLRLSAEIPLFFNITMLSWWTFVAGNIGVFIGFFRGSQDINPVTVLNITNVAQWEQLFNNLGMLLFFAFAIIGILYMISDDKGDKMFFYTVASIIPLVVGYFPFVLGRAVIPHRWYFLAQLLLSIPLAISMIHISNRSKNKSFRPVWVSGFVVALILLSMMSSVASIDNHAVAVETGVRYALTDSEIATFLMADGASGDQVLSDEYYSSRMGYLGYSAADISGHILDKNFDETGNHIILIREEISNRPFILHEDVYRLNYGLEGLLMGEHSKVINSGTVAGYIKD